MEETEAPEAVTRMTITKADDAGEQASKALHIHGPAEEQNEIRQVIVRQSITEAGGGVVVEVDRVLAGDVHG